MLSEISRKPRSENEIYSLVLERSTAEAGDGPCWDEWEKSLGANSGAVMSWRCGLFLLNPICLVGSGSDFLFIFYFPGLFWIGRHVSKASRQ